VVLRISLGSRVLIEGEKLLPKHDGEDSLKKATGLIGGEVSLLVVRDHTPDPESKDRSGKSNEKKEKSGDKGDKGAKGKGGKGVKGQGGAGGVAAVRVWQVNQEVCLSFNKSSPCVLSDIVMYPLLSESIAAEFAEWLPLVHGLGYTLLGGLA